MANQEIRSEKNIINEEFVNPTGDQDLHAASYPAGAGFVEFDPNDYHGETVYLEVVAKNTHGSDALLVNLHDSGDSEHESLSVPANTTSYTRIRSQVDTALTADVYHLYLEDGTSATWASNGSLLMARLVILLNTTTINTFQSSFEIGAVETFATEAYSAFTYPKYWFYDADQWDPTPTSATLKFTFATEQEKSGFYLKLQYTRDWNTWTDLETSGEIASTNDGDVEHDETSIGTFSLQDNAWYRVQIYVLDGKYDATIYNMHIDILHNDVGGIIKCVSEMHMIHEAESTTGSELDFITRWDPGEWNAEDGYVHAVHCFDCEDETAEVKARQSSTDIDGSDISGWHDAKDHQSMFVDGPAEDYSAATITLRDGSSYEAMAASYTPDGGKSIGALCSLRKSGTPGTIKLELYDDDGSGDPDDGAGGNPRATVTISAAILSSSEQRFHVILFDTGYDTSTAELHLVISHPGGDSSNFIYVGYSTSGKALYRNYTGDFLGSPITWSNMTFYAYLQAMEAMDMPGTAQDIKPWIVNNGGGNVFGSRILVFYKWEVAAGNNYYESIEGSLPAMTGVVSRKVTRKRGIQGSI